MMLGNEQRMRNLFGARFEEQGDGFLFRATPCAYPVRVTRVERDGYTADFIRGMRWAFWIGIALMLAMISILVLAAPPSMEAHQDAAMWGIIGVWIVLFGGTYLWLWHAPRRSLANRAPAGAARSAMEVRRHTLAQISWVQLAAAPLAAALLIGQQAMKHDLTQGWYRLWLAFGAALMIATAVQGWRKWRSSTAD